jgi:hypothetical protein
MASFWQSALRHESRVIGNYKSTWTITSLTRLVTEICCASEFLLFIKIITFPSALDNHGFGFANPEMAKGGNIGRRPMVGE